MAFTLVRNSVARLGFTVGALFFLCKGADAQVVPAPASEVPVPSKTATDSPAVVKKDTIKASVGVMSGVKLPEIGPEYRWKGNEIFATGAITLSDLLERVPGVTILRSGGIVSPQMARDMGGSGRVKIYLDGVELDNLDRRNESLDLSWVPLWSLEEVSIDRSAGEIRVNLRSLTVNSTTPYTRTDVYTGDENTNLYRGFYGKRYEGGQVIQLGAEQANSNSARGGQGEKLSALGRVGIAHPRWSIDAFANRTHGTRDLHKSSTGNIPIPEYDATTTYAYVRAVVGQATNGPWMSAIVSHLAFKESSPKNDLARATTSVTPVDTVDTARSEKQILLRAGLTRSFFRATVEDRIRNLDSSTYHDFTAAGQVNFRPINAGVRVKHSGFGTSRAEAWAKLQPLSFLAVNGSVGRNTPPEKTSPSFSATIPDFNFAHLEAGIKLFGPWLAAGRMTQDTLIAAAPTVFGQGFSSNTSGKGTATYGSLRGTFLRDFTLDVYGVRWDEEVFYRPQTQARTELRFRTKWLSKFPKGEFEINTSLTHNYRSVNFFRTGTVSSSVDAAQYLDFLLEIRILRGVATYQLRNVTGYAYENLPGFFAQRALNLYGIRWEFWN